MTPLEANRLLQILKSLTVIALTLEFYLDVTQAGSDEASKHLDLGKQMLAAGNLMEALSQFDLAVEQDSKNYLTYFRRATVYLAMGKSKSALPDLDKSIKLRPGFSAALIQRGNVYLKQGNLKAAQKDFSEVYNNDNSNQEAMELMMTIQPLEEDIENAKFLFENQDYHGAIHHLNRPIEHNLEIRPGESIYVKFFYKCVQFDAFRMARKWCFHSQFVNLNRPIELCPWNPELKEIRAECFIAIGELSKATIDLRATTKLRNDNTDGFFKLCNLYYEMGEAEDALLQVKECLRLDPDHKKCFPFYKKVKKLVKQLKDAQEASNNEDWDECVNKGKQILKTESEIHTFVLKGKSHICHCLAMGGHHKEAIKTCNEVLELDPDDANAMCDRAEARIANEQYEAVRNGIIVLRKLLREKKKMLGGHHKEAIKTCNEVLELDPDDANAMCDRAEARIANEQYEEAVKDFQKAMNIDENSQRARQGIDRAQKLLKNSQKRDYYKILGVKRNAKKKQITKAYRKLAMEWHPDKFEDEEDKKKAEKMFMDIAAAKEVLTDPEKRQKYDNGEDPLDPEQQQQGGNPFHGFHGFNPFGHGGGQGFNFKFHFN